MWDAQVDLVQYLNEEGQLTGPTSLTDEKLVEMYEQMLFARLFDERAMRLQRQGRLGTYPPLSGQEAAQVGSVHALRQGDWMFPSYREYAGTFVLGQTPTQALLYLMGHPVGGYTPQEINLFTVSIMISTQIPQAVGAAWASKLKGEDKVTIVYFGDGSTSKGDFHEGLNMASVHKVPIVFFCQNNHYAISLPFEKQTATPTIAQKAVAYQMEGVRVDGNDVVAVYEVTRAAVERARAGLGPTLIEALTYRLGPHTTSDDPTRYRNTDELQEWRERRDPLKRLRIYLESKNMWDEAKEQQFIANSREIISQAVREAESMPRMSVADALALVYEEMTPDLEKQRDEWLRIFGKGNH